MTALLLTVFLATSPLPCLGAGQNRNQTAVDKFKKANPCPTSCKTYVRQGSKFVVYEKCGACQVDHVCPLACCGLDQPQNMQWLPTKENRAKGADCSKCGVAPTK